MAKFLTTRGTTSEIENIINSAAGDIVLISPFIKIPDILLQNLRAVDQRGVRTTFVYGKNYSETNVIDQINQLKNAKLYFLDNLHAKCYFNENSMVITSLNLYDFSEQNNREMGILVTRQDDEVAFKDAREEAARIISLATYSNRNPQINENHLKPQFNKPVVVKAKTKSIWDIDVSDIIPKLFGNSDGHNYSHGYCIGCKTNIERNEERPYCTECYFKWSKNKSQKAKYCHDCGRESTTSMNKPLCRSCYSNSKSSVST
jgi:hypothetical protein